MKKYTTISKIALVICLGLMVLAVINGVTGFINSKISFSGTVISIVGMLIAIFAIIILEKETQINYHLRITMKG